MKKERSMTVFIVYGWDGGHRGDGATIFDVRSHDPLLIVEAAS